MASRFKLANTDNSVSECSMATVGACESSSDDDCFAQEWHLATLVSLVFQEVENDWPSVNPFQSLSVCTHSGHCSKV